MKESSKPGHGAGEKTRNRQPWRRMKVAVQPSSAHQPDRDAQRQLKTHGAVKRDSG